MSDIKKQIPDTKDSYMRIPSNDGDWKDPQPNQESNAPPIDQPNPNEPHMQTIPQSDMPVAIDYTKTSSSPPSAQEDKNTVYPTPSTDASVPRRHSSENSVSSFSSEWSDECEIQGLMSYQGTKANPHYGGPNGSYQRAQQQPYNSLQAMGDLPNRSPQSYENYPQVTSNTGCFQHQDIENYLPNNLNTGITDEELVLTHTRDLNKLLKMKGLSKNDVKAIKSKRRTLKNRGYAASCRVKRDDLSVTLEQEVDELEKKCIAVDEEILKKQERVDHLKNKYRRTLEWARNNLQIDLKDKFLLPHVIEDETF